MTISKDGLETNKYIYNFSKNEGRRIKLYRYKLYSTTFQIKSSTESTLAISQLIGKVQDYCLPIPLLQTGLCLSKMISPVSTGD